MTSSYAACSSLHKIAKRSSKHLSFSFWVGFVGAPYGQLKYSSRASKVETNPARRYLIVHHRSQPPSLLQEAHSLILTATGQEAADSITIGVKHEVAIRGGAAVRQGHLATIKGSVGSQAITDVILNFPTTASHLSRISQALQPTPDSSKCKTIPVVVKDRTGIVLDIFRKHASSAEARLQVRLAELRYQASRVVRRRDQQGRMVFGIAGQEAEVVSARGRGGQGAVGGSGEKEAVVVAARSRASIAKVVQQLQEVRKRRGLLRAQRRRDGHAVVALVGYTNAGKSTLMSAMCKEVWHEQDVGAADRLFATLDTKIRRAETEQAQPFLLVDTVGFIQGLPMELVAAFQATLDEALQADLVVHVIDASSPSALQQRRTVLGVLVQLGMSEQCLRSRTVEVWNKADCLIPDVEEHWPRNKEDSASRQSSWGCDEGQQQLWQLVQSYLYREARSQAQRAEPAHHDEHTSSSTHHLPESTDDVTQCKPDALHNSRHLSRPWEETGLEIESEASSTEHYMDLDDDSSINGSESSSRAASSRHGEGGIREQCTVGEATCDRYILKSEAVYREHIDTEHEYDEGSTDESDSGDEGLLEPCPRQRFEGANSEWISQGSAVIVAANTGLGLSRLTQVITQKLQFDSKSRV